MKIRLAIKYYISSLPTIVLGIKNFWLIPLTIFKIPVILKLKGGFKFKSVSLMDVWAVKEIILDKQYEQFESIRPGWTIIDIGAGIGDFSIMNDSKAKKVFAYEKDEEKAQLIKENLRLNNCQKITLIHQAATDLKKVFEENKIVKCSLLKIDCEGCEYPLFLNCPEEILQKIERVVMEHHCFNKMMSNQLESLKQKLKSNGFKIKTKENAVHSNIGFLYARKK